MRRGGVQSVNKIERFKNNLHIGVCSKEINELQASVASSNQQ